jgi:hypothetical protein
MGWICGTYEGTRGAYKVLVGEPEGKRPSGRPRRKWENKIKMHLQEMEKGMGMIDLVQYRGHVTGSCESGNEPSCSIKCGEFLD